MSQLTAYDYFKKKRNLKDISYYKEQENKSRQIKQINKKQQASSKNWEEKVKSEKKQQGLLNPDTAKKDYSRSPIEESKKRFENIVQNMQQRNVATNDKNKKYKSKENNDKTIKPFSLMNDYVEGQRQYEQNKKKTQEYENTSTTYKTYEKERQKSMWTQYFEDLDRVENEDVDTSDKINVFRPFVSSLEKALAPRETKLKNGESVNLPSYNELKTNKVMSEMGMVGQAIHGASSSLGHMAPSMLASAIPFGIGKIAGPATTFATTMNSAQNEKLLSGYTPKQARQYALVNASLETGLQNVLGGLTKITGGKQGFLQKNLDKVLNKIISNPGGRRLLSSAGSELVEEELQNLLDPVNEHITLGEYKTLGEALSQWDWDEATTTALSTLLTVGLTEGPTALKVGNMNKQIKNLNEQYGTDFKINTDGQIQDGKTNKKLTGAEVDEKIKTAKVAQLQERQLNDIEQRQQQASYDYQNGNITEEQYNKELEQISNELKAFTEEQNNNETNPITEIEADQEILQDRLNNSEITEKQYNSEMDKLNTRLREISGKPERYQYTPGESESINKLEESASKYFDNSEKSRNYIEMLKKISIDKGLSIIFDDSIGDNINGQYQNGVITINPNSNRAGEFIAIHELTHAIGTEQMKSIIETYRRSNTEFDQAVKSLMENYDASEINEEAMADVAGQLFGNQEFINNMAQKNPSLFQRIYKEIKYLYHQFRGYKNQNQFIEDLQYKWEQAYRNNIVNKAEEVKHSKKVDKTGDFVEIDIDQEQFDNLSLEQQRKLAKEILKDKYNGLINDEINLSNRAIKEYTNPQARISNTKKRTKYRLSTELDNLYDVAQKINNELIPNDDTHKYHNFAKDGWNYYYARFKFGDNEFIGKINEGISDGTPSFYDITDIHTPNEYKKMAENGTLNKNESALIQPFLENNIPQSDKNVNSDTSNKYSMQNSKNNTHDNAGKELSKRQQEYFKDSKVRDENGNLEIVYHQTNADFTEFKNGFSKRGFKNANFFTNQKPNKILKNVMEGYVAINKPLYLENVSINQSIVDKAIQDGYDGIINQNVQGIEGKKEIITFESKQFKNANNINPTPNSDIRYSKNTEGMNDFLNKNIPTKDNQGRELSKEQKEYFKDSKAKDKDGNLVTVYHTTTNKGSQFNEFNPVGTDHYRFDDQVVNYYTDSKDMSGSYADNEYKMADGSKIETDSDVNKAINYYNGISNSHHLKLDKNKNGTYFLYDNKNRSEYRMYENKEKLYKNLVQDLQAISGKNNSKWQYEGYVNLTNPYVIDADGENWDSVSNTIPKKVMDEVNEITKNKELKQALTDLANKSVYNHNELYSQQDQEKYDDYRYKAKLIKDSELQDAVETCAMYQFEYDDYASKFDYLPKGSEGINEQLRSIPFGKDETISDFVREYGQLYKANMEYGTPESYFKQNYKNILGKEVENLNSQELFNIAFQDFREEFYEQELAQNSSTNDIVKEVIEMNKNGANYDGVIMKNVIDYGGESETFKPHDLYVTFNSNQFKNVDNTTPTEDADIRYSKNTEGMDNFLKNNLSVSKDGKLQDSNGKEVKLETSSTGTTGTLMAMHNLSSEKLQSILELGGFPVPSIAITNPKITSHDNYGNISVLFDKNTIDPAIKQNEVYNSDIYSTRFPNILHEINKNKWNDFEKWVKENGGRVSSLYSVRNNIENNYLDERNMKANLEVAFDNPTQELIDEAYNRTMDTLGNKRIEKSGIDPFRHDGSRKPLSQTSSEYTLDNLVKEMTKKRTKGSEGNAWTGTGEIRANTAKQFKSIKDIKNNENSIVSHEEMQKTRDELDNKLSDLVSKISKYYKYDNTWQGLENATYGINETAKSKVVTKEVLRRQLSEDFIEGVPDALLTETIDFLNSLKNAPTEYFEAKPQRAVGLNEVQAIVLPNNVDSSLKEQLQKSNIAYYEYDPNIEGDRNRVINQFDDLKFSKNNQNFKEYIEDNFKATGTRTNFADIVQKTKPQQQTANLEKMIQKPITREKTTNNLTQEEQNELKSLREIDNAGIAGDTELNRIEYLENKQKGNIKFAELKPQVEFKDISREYGKFKRDIGDFNPRLLNKAMDSVDGYRNTRTKDQWLDVAENIGSNYKGNAKGLKDYAVQSWFQAKPNMKENLNRQGQKYVKFSVDEWVNSVYKGAGVGEISSQVDTQNNIMQDMTKQLKDQQKAIKDITTEVKEAVNPIKHSMESITKQIDDIRETLNLPKRKIMNPVEIAKLTKADASTTTKLADKKVSTGKGESSFANNILNKTDMLTDFSKEKILSELGTKYYKQVTNEDSMSKALDRLEEGGASETLNWFQKASDNADSTDVAEGWILMKQYQDTGDYDGMVQVAKKMREIGTKAGQTVQAFNIMERLTPEGMVKYAQSELSEAYDQMIKNKTKAWIDEHRMDFELTGQEVQFILDTMNEVSTMEDGYDKKVKLAEIQKIMTDKLPADKNNAIKSWMRISMLFNPKTQVRNVVGNAIIAPVNYASDIFASAVDKAISKKTNVRTTGTINVKAVLKGFKEGAYQATNDYKRGINTKDMEGNRFEIGEGKTFSDKTLIGKSLNRVDSLLNYVMDAGDRIFSQSSFENSLQNQMILNNTTEVTQDMIDIARNESLSRTWNDNNNYTRFVLNVRKMMNTMKIGGYGVGDILIPFAKTPANLTKAIVDYSPAGLINTLIQGKNLKRSIENGQYTPQMQHQFVQSLGKATAGTMLYVLGYALAKSGVISGESDDDKDTANFLKNTLGVNSYSIKIGGKSFTYDWAQPISAPLSIMANIVNSKNKNKEQALLEGIVGNLDTAGSILMEQSFMQSLNEVLTNNDGVVSGLVNQILQLPARAIPTFMKQLVDLTDSTQRTSYEYGKPVQSAINAIKAKIPGLSTTLAPSVDTMGREIKRHGGKNNIFNVFLNPANVSTENISTSAEEIYRLYQQTGDKTIMPRVAPYYINSKGQKITFTSKEKAEFQKISGGIVETSIQNLLNDDTYQSLSDTDKADVINNLVNYSYNKAQMDIAKTPVSSRYKNVTKYVNSGGDPGYYYLHKKEIDYQIKNPSKYNYIKQITSYDNYQKYTTEIKNIREKYKNATTATRKAKTISYINSLDLSAVQKAMLIRKYYTSYNSYNSKIYNYVNQSDLSASEKLGVYKELGFKVKGGRVRW